MLDTLSQTNFVTDLAKPRNSSLAPQLGYTQRRNPGFTEINVIISIHKRVDNRLIGKHVEGPTVIKIFGFVRIVTIDLCEGERLQ